MRVLTVTLGYVSLAFGAFFAMASSPSYRWTCAISAIAAVGALIFLGASLKPSGRWTKPILIVTMCIALFLLVSDLGVVLTSPA